MYDGLLRMELLDGARVVGFADDVALAVTAVGEDSLRSLANTAILRINTWMKKARLGLAPENIDAILLITKRKVAPIEFEVQGHRISPVREAKYLDVWLDKKTTLERLSGMW